MDEERVQLPPPPPRHNPTKSKEVQNQLGIAGSVLILVQRRAIIFINVRIYWGLISSDKPPKIGIFHL
jgi:hypothetical protein